MSAFEIITLKSSDIKDSGAESQILWNIKYENLTRESPSLETRVWTDGTNQIASEFCVRKSD